MDIMVLGKAQLFLGVNLYKNLVLNEDYLLNDLVKKEVADLTNQRVFEISIEVVIKIDCSNTYKHYIKVKDSMVAEEVVSLLDEDTSKNDSILIKAKNGIVEEVCHDNKKYLKLVNEVRSPFSSLVIKCLLLEKEKKNYKITKLKKLRFTLLNLYFVTYDIEANLSSMSLKKLNFSLMKEHEFSLDSFLLANKIESTQLLQDGTCKVPNESFKEFLIYFQRLERLIKVFKEDLIKLSFDDIPTSTYHNARLIFIMIMVAI